MKTFIRIILAVLVVLGIGMQPADADRGGHGRHRGGHVEFGLFLGPGWWGPYPYSYSPYYPYHPYYSPPPVIIQQQPPEIRVEPSTRPDTPSSYWYYCQDPQGYYPNVKKCPKGWMKVVPPTNPSGEEE